MLLALTAHWPGWTSPVSEGAAPPEFSGNEITLTVDHLMRRVDGRSSHDIGTNGHVPRPLIRLKEGQCPHPSRQPAR
ncbi:hypothetical protein [Sphingomonas sp. IW22]|uniref:hypothetical protein n=1 Tax=Sphingomonas sp. IW22 TaxID=3242489 RepID=UPI0035230A51